MSNNGNPWFDPRQMMLAARNVQRMTSVETEAEEPDSEVEEPPSRIETPHISVNNVIYVRSDLYRELQ